jgi:FkbM family methyltransferase
MSNIIDLASRRQAPPSSNLLSHPAGVSLPFDDISDADLVIPEVRGAICSGLYNSDIIRALPEVVQEADRVLVIGAGLGVVSTLVANEGVSRVIAVEANIALIPYLRRVHAQNGVPWVETVNAVLADGMRGRIPFFAQRDVRISSLLPNDESRQQVLIVPLMDLNLILTEERINLIICDIPNVSVQLLAQANLGSVDRILVNCGDGPTHGEEDNEARSKLVTMGFTAESYGPSVLFERSNGVRERRRSNASNFIAYKSA